MSLLPPDSTNIPPLRSSPPLIFPKPLASVLEPTRSFLFAGLFPKSDSLISYSTFESFCKDSQNLIPRDHCNCNPSNKTDQPSICNGCSSISEIFSQFSSNSFMSFSQFLDFLVSPEFNPLFSPSSTSNKIDMSLPLSQYYISSSHNTYLIGSQVLGTSSTLYYRNVLLKNCRCLEIDIWDSDDKPVVSHGPTLTSPVQLIDVLKTIKQYGFAATDLPLILSIEIHCCEDYQLQVKDLFIQELGDSLFFMPSNDENPESDDKELTLRHFLNTIIIKMKRPNLLSINDASSSSSSSLLLSASSSDYKNFYGQQEGLSVELLQSILYDEYDESNLKPSSSTAKKLFSSSDDRASLSSTNSMDSTTRIHSYTSTITSTSTLNSLEEFNNGHNDNQQYSNSVFSNPSNKSSSAAKFHIIPQLYELSSYIYGLKFHSFEQITSVGVSSEVNSTRVNNHCFSFSNKRFKSIVPKSKFQIHKHNKTYLMRIYPASYKVTSKNYNAVPFWKFGCQMVATNWQTYDIDQQINEAMFIQGFVKKPGYLLSTSCDGSNKHSQNSLIDKSHFKDVDVDFQFLALFNDFNSNDPKNSISLDSNLNTDSTSNNFNVSLQIIDKEAKIFATKLQCASTVMATISKVFKKKKPIFKTTNPLVVSDSDHLCVIYSSKISARIEKTLKDFIFLKFSINKSISAVVRLVYLNRGYRVLQLRNDRTGELTNYKLLIKINY